MNGTTIVSPENTYIDVVVQLGRDRIIEPFTYRSAARSKLGTIVTSGPIAFWKGRWTSNLGQRSGRFST